MKRLVDESVFEPDNEAQRRALAFLRTASSSRSGPSFPVPGDRVAEFTIERELGRGGMGVVYRAVQAPLGRAVALKLVPHEPGAMTYDHARRLEREARMLASVRHPSIPMVHAAGVVPGFHFVAVELIDGATLKDVMRRAATELPRPGEAGWLPFVLDVLHSVAGGLGAAHARGIVHRDVKPSNVLVDRAGHAFLADFGLARERAVTGMTLTRGFVGTPQYASPEQTRGEPCGAASDVFSFGALAFEAVGGTQAFEGRTAHELAQRIFVVDPAWPTGRRVPRDLRTVIEKCLEKDARDRYPDGRAVEEELACIRRFEPVRATQRGRLGRAWRRVRRQPARVLIGAGAIALLASAGVAGELIRERRQTLELQAREDERDEVVRNFGRGRVEEYIAGLEKLLALGEPLTGVSGRLADMRVLRGRASEAAILYSHEIDLGEAYFADLIGSCITQALVRGETPYVDLATLPAPEQGRDLMMLAFYHECRRDYEAALEAITAAQEKQAACMEFRLQAVRYLEQLGRTDAAAEQMLIAWRNRPSDGRFPRKLAELRYRQGRYEEAERILCEALRHGPEEARTLALSALCERRLSQRGEALDRARRAYALAPDDGFVVSALAVNFAREQRAAAARALVKAAAVRTPADPDLLQCAARLALESGDREASDHFARRLAALAEQTVAWSVPSLELAGDLQLARGELDGATATFRALLAREPEIPDWPLKLALALERAGKLVEAEAVVDRALARDPSAAELTFAKVRLRFAAGQPMEAFHACERVLGQPGAAGRAHYWMGTALLDTGEPTVALDFARRAVAAHDDWMEAWNLQARCQAATGALTEALASYQEALSIRDEPAVRADMAEVLHQLGRDEEALDSYAQARAADPTLATTWGGAGIVLLERGASANETPALANLERARQLDPGCEEYRLLVEQVTQRQSAH